LDKKSKSIAVFIGSRANWGRLKSVCKAIKNHPNLELNLIVGASGLWCDIPYPHERIECLLNSDTTQGMCLTTGLLLTQVATILDRLKPDIVLVHGDRYEVLAVATASAYMNIPLAHTEGGEDTGTIDDKVRYAISSLADIHFVVTEYAKSKIPTSYVVGSTALDDLKPIKNPGDYVVILHHPNTTHPEDITPLIEAVKEIPIKKYWVNPNVDAGARDMLKSIHKTGIEFVKDLPPEQYIDLIYNSKCLIGNTSSGIKEGAYLGIPYLCVGNRQQGREIGNNTLFVPMCKDSILKGYENRLQFNRDPDYKFGDGTASKKIMEVLNEYTKEC